ncbi:MAG: U32 family peptidase [Candidatus Omnitrophota bacterium]|jgi:collagenase-like PrtC family protease
MKILSAFSKKDEVLPLIDAGADELYCGIVPYAWEAKYSVFDTLNRREGYGANFSSFNDLSAAVRSAHNREVPVFITMNGLYTPGQYPLIRRIIHSIELSGADGLIIADIGLLLSLRKWGFRGQVHMGTGGTTFNSQTALFYKQLGACRIILDRQLTVGEIKDIARRSAAKVDLEVFILNTLCSNVDGFCTFYHGLPVASSQVNALNRKNMKVRFFKSYDPDYQGHGCSLNFSKEVFDLNGKKLKSVALKKAFLQGDIHKSCGVCALFDFNKMKIKALKIVERGAPLESKLRDTRFVRQAVDVLKKKRSLSRGDFISAMRSLYCQTYGFKACSGFSCYYPSVFAKEGGK